VTARTDAIDGQWLNKTKLVAWVRFSAMLMALLSVLDTQMRRDESMTETCLTRHESTPPFQIPRLPNDLLREAGEALSRQHAEQGDRLGVEWAG
jgi:hypothetical protein